MLSPHSPRILRRSALLPVAASAINRVPQPSWKPVPFGKVESASADIQTDHSFIMNGTRVNYEHCSRSSLPTSRFSKSQRGTLSPGSVNGLGAKSFGTKAQTHGQFFSSSQGNRSTKAALCLRILVVRSIAADRSRLCCARPSGTKSTKAAGLFCSLGVHPSMETEHKIRPVRPAPAQGGDGLRAGTCRVCGLVGNHAGPLECVAALRNWIADLSTASRPKKRVRSAS